MNSSPDRQPSLLPRLTSSAENLARILYDGVDIEDMDRDELIATVRAIARDYEIECKAHHAANKRHAEFLKRAFREAIF